MSKLRKYVVNHSFKNFLPLHTDFKLIEEPIEPLQEGQFLVKAEYISVDPYMRSFAESCQIPYEQFAFQVGKVIDSKNDEFNIGDDVVSHSGWRDYVVLDGEPDDMFQIIPYKIKTDGLPLSLAIGALGMPGITAYLGFLEICKPKRGDIVCVTSAAGAVGSLVGQLARIKGCTVIGFTGSDEKVKILNEDLDFHYAFNYKTEKNVEELIHAISLDGVDCFFDNVGGNLADTIMSCMKKNGRVAKCGSISLYGQEKAKEKPKAPSSVRVKSFSFTQWSWPQQYNAILHLKELLLKGEIKARQTIKYDFEHLPDALIAMLNGDNIGKTVVKV